MIQFKDSDPPRVLFDKLRRLATAVFGLQQTVRPPILHSTGYVVAGLPTEGVTAGARAHVTDADSPSFGSAVVGGGAVVVPVFFDGTDWIVG